MSEPRTSAAEILELGDAFCELDDAFRVVRVNARQEQLTGIPRSHSIGKSHWELWPESARPDSPWWREYHRCMEERVPVAFENEYAPLGLWMSVTAYPTTRGGIAIFFRDVSARRRAEEALRETTQRYRQLFHNMLEGFAYCRMIFGEEGRADDFVYLDVNGAFERLTGLRDVVGKRVSEVIPGIREAHPELLETYARVARTGAPERFEIDVRPLGILLAISVYCPQPGHFVAVFDNVTQERRAAEELRASEARLRAIFESTADAVVVTDPRGGGRVLSANPAACRLLGYREDELVGLDRAAILDTADARLSALLAERGDQGHAAAELTYIRKDGTRFRGELTTATFEDAAGDPQCITIIRDVTERKRVEKRLLDSEAEARTRAAELEAILDCTADGILVYDRRGRTIRSNPAADAILAIPLEDRRAPVQDRVLAQYDVLTEDGRRVRRDEMVAVRAALHGETVLGETFQIRARDHDPRWVIISGRPLLVAGEHAGAVVSLTDVTERKRAEEALRRSEEELREADRRKDEFLGMLSHELRNPLAPIRNSAYVLRHAAPGGEQAARAQAVIERQVEHLTRLVDDLLDVTRIARGKIALRRSRVDLCELVRRTTEDFRRAMEEKGVALRVVAPDAIVDATVDATRIAQVVGNLLHNAAKFTRPGDEVVVTLAVDGDAVELAVRDTGAGIEPALLPRVFDAFVQGERTLARTDGGLGLGLALVRGIADLHGGTVAARSAGKGKGAEFVVRLPGHVAPAPIARRERDPVRGDRVRRVLVVDDNVDAAESLADVVKLLGHVVEVAYDGQAAIERARANPPDVVLCDIGLPGRSGYEVAQALRATVAEGMRLIAVTGYAQPEDVRRAIEAGFDGHVAKPCDPEKLGRLLG